MRNGWPMVRLGEVMRESRQAHAVKRDQQYPNFGIYSFGRGVFPKPPIDGMGTSASTLYRARAGQFVYSRLFAFEGAYGVVPRELDGYFVSNEFPLFDCDPQRLLPEYLRRYLSMRRVWESVATASTGVGHRRQRVQPEALLKFPVPLPPIEEQRRIVTRIEALAAKIGAARSLVDSVVSDADALCQSILFDPDARWSRTSMRNIVRRRGCDVQVQADGEYQFAGVYCFGRGVFRSKKQAGTDFAYRQLTRLRAGDFVYPKLMAWEGALAIVPAECHGCVVSPEFPVFEPDATRVLPETLDVYFRTPSVWPELSGASTGTNVRRRRLNPDDFLDYRMPLPPLSVQRKLAAIKAKAETLKSLQQRSAAELEAMLPSILDRAFKGELTAPAAAIAVSAPPAAPAPGPFADLADLVIRAYFDVRDGWSTEYLLSSPDLSHRFIERCAALGAERTPRDLLAALINARRAGALKGSAKARKFSIPRNQMDLFSFASEMAFRCIQDRLQAEQQRDLTVDAMLTNPALATEFDQFAARLAPGYEPLQYRWTAITLRKDREFSDASRPVPLFDDLGRTDDVRVGRLPETEGVYCVTVEHNPLFVAVAENLRTQVDRLLDGTKKRVTPEWMVGERAGVPRLHVLSMPKCSIGEREVARARVLREGFGRLNFLGGPLFEHGRSRG